MLLLSDLSSKTYNWMWSFFFVVAFAGAATDIFYNRSELTIRHKGEVIDLTNQDWCKYCLCYFYVVSLTIDKIVS